MYNSTTGEHSPFVKVEKTTGDVNSNFSIKAEQQELSAGNAGYKEPAGTERIKYLEDKLFYYGAMLEPPCFCCGYNGRGYFQPENHPCAERHHKFFRGF